MCRVAHEGGHALQRPRSAVLHSRLHHSLDNISALLNASSAVPGASNDAGMGSATTMVGSLKCRLERLDSLLAAASKLTRRPGEEATEATSSTAERSLSEVCPHHASCLQCCSIQVHSDLDAPAPPHICIRGTSFPTCYVQLQDAVVAQDVPSPIQGIQGGGCAVELAPGAYKARVCDDSFIVLFTAKRPIKDRSQTCAPATAAAALHFRVPEAAQVPAAKALSVTANAVPASLVYEIYVRRRPRVQVCCLSSVHASRLFQEPVAPWAQQ